MLCRSLHLQLGFLHKESLAWMDDGNQSVRYVLVKTKNTSSAILFDILHCGIEIYQKCAPWQPLSSQPNTSLGQGEVRWQPCLGQLRRFEIRLG
jgi:hypothetical protein